ncbi:MAG TPA: hypothetical protein VGR95_19760 [Thermoanaerobaculia bacterium]|jgi:hypothetical protein|nr:hypothetical protein [Thermoanaerobaculia bacterium]
MINESEWPKAYRDGLEDAQRRVGPPPTDEQLERLQRGELPQDEADRIRERLSYYPELARAIAMPFPEENTALAPEELEADIAALRKKLHEQPEAPAVFPAPRERSHALSIAAAILVSIAIAGIAIWIVRRGEPRGSVTRVLYADGHRGAGAQMPIQLSTATDYLLQPVFRPERPYAQYRLDLLQAGTASPRVIRSYQDVQRQANGTYPIPLTTARLTPGLYELVLYGVEGGAANRLAVYTMRVSAP